VSGAPKTDGGGIAALCVRRPVLTIVINLLVLIAGIAALSGVEIRELPNVDRPIVTVRTDWDGATPASIDTQVTGIIEGAIARVPGVVTISSRSDYGESRVTIEFDPSVDIDVAANDVRNAVSRIERQLPDDLDDPPTVVKSDADADAIMRLAVTSPTMPIEDLTSLVNDEIVDRLAAVPGVADVSVYGDREAVLRITLDPQSLASRGIGIDEVADVVAGAALDMPAGTFESSNQNLIVRADASAITAPAIAALVIRDGTRVGDVATVSFGPDTGSSTIRLNGRTGIGLGIVRQAQSNTLAISEAVHAAIAELQQTMPSDVEITVTSDDAVFIDGSIHEVLVTLLLATIIVIATIWLFLGSLRATLIPAVAVPIALVGTLAAIWLVGFSVNILTLLALVLATGLVVDDAIVVLENIERYRAMRVGTRAAAVIGARQVFFAVIATTATLVSVFVPISFLPGTAGRLFIEFGFVMAIAVLLSAMVALTLTPMLASRLGHGGHATYPGPVAAAGRGLASLYRRLLDAALAAPLVVFTICALFAIVALGIFRALPEELTPPEDRGSMFISVQAPQAAGLDFTDRQLRAAEAVVTPLLDSGEARQIFTIAGNGGANSGFIIITLAPWEQRSRSQQAIAASLQSQLDAIPGARLTLRSSNSLGIRGGGTGLQFAITGTSYDDLAHAAEALIGASDRMPGLRNLSLSYDTTQPQLSVTIDRERASDLGVPIDGIATALQTVLDGREVANLFIGDDTVPIRLQAKEGSFVDPDDLDSLTIASADGHMVPLSSLMQVSETAVAPSLGREGQRRAVPLTAQLQTGVDLRSAMEQVSAAAEEVLPAGMEIRFLGEAAALNQTSSGVATTFGFALLVVLLVLAAQFESFVGALVILSTVPFGLAAAALAIGLTGGSLNVYSQIGLVMLVGLMAKNGILIVEFADQLRDQGRSVRDAIREACAVRLRPVMMTMIATVAGGVPLILTGGAGGEARAALGWIIVGGLGFSTLFTLFVTPVAYLVLGRFRKPRGAEQRRLDEELATAAGGREAPPEGAPAE
jgi:HAE1 family hydrophobic/amphiphilic exporter-1